MELLMPIKNFRGFGGLFLFLYEPSSWFSPFLQGGHVVFIATPIVYHYFSPAISICMFCNWICLKWTDYRAAPKPVLVVFLWDLDSRTSVLKGLILQNNNTPSIPRDRPNGLEHWRKQLVVGTLPSLKLYNFLTHSLCVSVSVSLPLSYFHVSIHL